MSRPVVTLLSHAPPDFAEPNAAGVRPLRRRAAGGVETAGRLENALTAAAAEDEIRAGAGTQFDAGLVEALSRLLERGLVF